MAYGDHEPTAEILNSIEAESFETETCIGCGLTVEIDGPVFLEWDADFAGRSTCPDCRDPDCQDPERQNTRQSADELPATPRQAA